MINLNQLRFAQAVARTGSFSRAAELCHIGQPSLSTAVAQLEATLGGRLFARSTRRVSLTPFGSHLLPLIDGALGAEQEVRQAATAWHRPALRLIRVGFSPAVNLGPIQLALTAWQRDHPDSDVVLKECLHDDLDSRLSAGTIDLALVVSTEAPGRNALQLAEEPLQLLPRGGKTGGSAATLQSLAGETFVFTRGCGLATAVTGLFRRGRVRIRQYPGQALSYQVIEQWAELGLGAGILPRSKLSGAGAGAIPLLIRGGHPAMIRTYARWAPGREGSAPERQFLTWLGQRASAIARGVAPVAAPTITEERRKKAPVRSRP